MESHSVAVVPIFMSAGAAVLPTVVGALASVVAVLFKPRELLRLCRARPGMMGGMAAGLVALVAGVVWWIEVPRTAVAVVKTRETDWSKVAQDLISQAPLHAGSIPLVTSAGPFGGGQGTATSTRQTVSDPLPQTSSTVPAMAIGGIANGQDFARTLYRGGASPGKLAPLWAYRPEGGMFLSVPVLDPSGKRVFAAGCQSDLGGYTGIMACLDAETGKVIWEVTDYKDEPLKAFFSSPTVTADGKYVIVGQGLHEDRDCLLLCFEAATGKIVWGVKTPLHIESSPAIFGDMVVVGAGAIEGKDGKAIGDPGYLFAVRISDGKELWRQPVNDPESAPVVDETGMVIEGSGFNGTAVVAMRSESDEELKERKLDRVVWKTPVAYPVTGPLTLIGDMVIAGGGNSDVVHSNRNAKGQVIALDRKMGRILWQVTTEDSILGAIACRDDVALCPSRTGEVIAISLKDGMVMWRTRISGNSPVIGGCGFTDQRAYAVSGDGYLAVLDPKSGKILEKVYLNDPAKPGSGLTASGPVISGGRIYIGSETGGFRCFGGTENIGGEVKP